MLVIAWVIISSLCCSLWSLPFLRSSLDCLQSLLLSHFRLHRGGCFFRFLMIWFNLIGLGRVLKVFLAIPAKIFWRLGRPVAFLGKTIGWLWVWQNLWWFVGAKETHKLPSREALGRFFVISLIGHVFWSMAELITAIFSEPYWNIAGVINLQLVKLTG